MSQKINVPELIENLIEVATEIAAHGDCRCDVTVTGKEQCVYCKSCEAMDALSEDKYQINALKELIVHMWVQSGYDYNGYSQMTTEQKNIYCDVVGYQFDPIKPLAPDKALETK